MGSHIMLSPFKLFWYLFFLSYMEINISHGKISCSSSCGSLPIIKHPFRLRGDPAACGNHEYEFNCEGNHTVFELPPNKYYVTDISYSKFKITLLDVGLARDNCSLPTGSLSDMDYLGPFRFDYMDYYGTANFMNCSKVVSDQRYEFIPCLSKNNSIIYVVQNYGNIINCSKVYTLPITNYFGLNTFEQVKQGFQLIWDPTYTSTVEAIQLCVRIVTQRTCSFIQSSVCTYHIENNLFDMVNLFLYEIDFLECLQQKVYNHYMLAYISALLVFIVFDILLVILVLLLIGRFLFAPLCVLSFLAYNLFKLYVPIDIVERFLQNQEALSPSRYCYNEIITITNNFEVKLGQGGFGSVYKGTLPGGYLVAVKMLGKSMSDGEDFINEVSTIGRIHHVFVVQLVGFCVDGAHRALVYEYMANGSLEKYIFSSNMANKYFTMEKLIEIALSVAKGLDYLHQGCNTRILHFDIKPHNILLDNKFTPKISDFGLAKLYPKGHSLVSISAARGTIGYIAPELISRSFGPISHKSDVYSFGMLLMDMAGKRKHVDVNAENSSQIYYPSWIYDQLQKEVSENVIIDISDLEKKLCIVGFWCIQTRPLDRPCMTKVVEMLETDVNTLQMPPKKPFFSSMDTTPPSNFCINSSQSELSIILES